MACLNAAQERTGMESYSAWNILNCDCKGYILKDIELTVK